MAAVLIVGYLQLKAGEHTQERLSLDEHNTRSKDESEVKLGTTCSWQLAVIAARASSTSRWRLLPPRELPSAASASRRISSTSQSYGGEGRNQAMSRAPARGTSRPLC